MEYAYIDSTLTGHSKTCMSPNSWSKPVSPSLDSPAIMVIAFHLVCRSPGTPFRGTMRQTNKRTYSLAGLVGVITFLVYLGSLHNDFIAEWDDGEYVLDNPFIRSISPAFFKWAFFDFYSSNWHPLTWISHALDYAIWGLNPLGHHVSNNILHAVNVFLVVVLIMRLQEFAKGTVPSGQKGATLNEAGMLITAGVTGLLFGLHPIHVESVAWIAERKDLLCALFFLLSILAHLRYVSPSPLSPHLKCGEAGFFPFWREDGWVGRKWYFLSLSIFVLALMSKPMAVSLPIVLLILDWYPLSRLHPGKAALAAFVEKIPFFAFSLISSALTILAQRAGGAIIEIRVVPLSSRLLIAVQSLVAYIEKMIVPIELIPYYPYPKGVALFSVKSLLAIALVVGITFACAMISSKQKVWLAALGYYAITLLPVIGIVQVGSQSMADRYTYLPSLAPFLIVGLGASWVYNRMMINRQRPALIVGIFFLCTGVVIFGCLSFLTIRQIHIWENGLSVWSYVVEKEPGRASIAYTNLGLVYQKMGRLSGALENYEKAIALDKYDYLAYNNRGTIFYKLGQFDKAVQSYDKAVTLKPDDYRAYYNRALTYDKVGRLNEAIEDLQRAVRLKGGDPLILNNLGLLYGKAGMYERSIAALTEAIALEPNNPATYNNRGISYASINQYTMAIEDFSKTILLNENYAIVYFSRGDAYFKTGAIALALADFAKGCSLGDADACNALQKARMMMTKPQEK